MKRWVLFLILGAAAEISAQSGDARLDSIFNRYISAHGAHAGEAIAAEPQEDSLFAGEKCGLPALIEIMNGYDRLSAEQKKVFSKTQVKSASQKTLISPSGFFRINYDTTGIDAPNYDPYLTTRQNAMLAAKAFDSSYVFEVGFLGFPPPPLNGPYYDVYISNLTGYYGETVTNGRISEEKYYSYINIDNDFSTFYTKGEKALQVTAAHEFHHSIQIGNYIYPNNNDVFFLELTSTSMEEFVYDDVNDYYNYLKNYFRAPYKNFINTNGNGYDLCIWNLFLQKKYGYDEFKQIIKRQWQLFAEQRSMRAIDQSLLEAGSSFRDEFAEFSVWNYFTGHRSIAGKYYDEAAAYPLIAPTHTTGAIPYSVTANFQPLSANYYYFDTQTELENDTLAAILINCNIPEGLGASQGLSVVYSLTNYDYDGTELKVNSSLSAADKSYWSVIYIYNNTPFIPSILQESSLDYPFPNPYLYSYSASGTEISIPIKNKRLERANLNVYSVSGALVYRDVKTITPFGGTYIIRWNGLNNDNEKLPAGIYFYAAECDGDIYKGKIAIFNE